MEPNQFTRMQRAAGRAPSFIHEPTRRQREKARKRGKRKRFILIFSFVFQQAVQTPCSCSLLSLLIPCPCLCFSSVLIPFSFRSALTEFSYLFRGIHLSLLVLRYCPNYNFNCLYIGHSIHLPQPLQSSSFYRLVFSETLKNITNLDILHICQP